MTAPRPRVLVIGEALMDVIRHADDETTEHVGGSPANVAVGLARLDHDVELATCLGQDDRGQRIQAHLQRHGVQLSEGTAASGAPTSVALAELDSSGAATYTFDIAWEPGRIRLPEVVSHVHTGSIAAALDPGAADVLDAIGRAAAMATISFDPNVRPSIVGDRPGLREQIEAVIALSDVVKASEDDLPALYGDDVDLEAVVERWLALGPSLVVITRGPDGVIWRTASSPEPAALPSVAGEVVDTVGAGDSFMAGLLSGLLALDLLGDPAARARLREATLASVRPAIERGSACSGLTVGRAGAYAPSLDEL
ncbi:carbohydrate kinase family protein [Janibacter sp. G1551]|uniref:carbohydrate kinase family protein n=1 Tax=Janibacter sp. G1551 TaxID=3420440 RepID=UPI003CFE0BC2